MADPRKNRSIWASESEFNNMKQILELMRSGVLVLGAPNESVSESCSKTDSKLCSLLTWLLYYYEYSLRNKVHSWEDGSVIQEAVLKDRQYCDGEDSFLQDAKSRIVAMVGDFKLDEFPIVKTKPEEEKEKPKPKPGYKNKINPFIEQKRAKRESRTK